MQWNGKENMAHKTRQQIDIVLLFKPSVGGESMCIPILYIYV